MKKIHIVPTILLLMKMDHMENLFGRDDERYCVPFAPMYTVVDWFHLPASRMYEALIHNLQPKEKMRMAHT
jgi:hypothetical protein